jgi:hypothetical protein
MKNNSYVKKKIIFLLKNIKISPELSRFRVNFKWGGEVELLIEKIVSGAS